MGKALKIALPLVALALVVAGAWLAYGALGGREDPDIMAPTTSAPAATTAAPEDGAATEATTEPAPQYLQAFDFTVYTPSGEAVTLSESFGRPVVVNFWASWCGPCAMEMPAFQTLYDEVGESVCFLMVNLTDGGQETAETATAFIAAEGYTFPIYLDSDLLAAYAYGVSSVPQTFIFDRSGYLAGYQQGTLSEAGLRKGIDMALQQAPLTDGLAPAGVPLARYAEGTVEVQDMLYAQPCAEPGLSRNVYRTADTGQSPQAAALALIELMAQNMADPAYAHTRSFTVTDYQDITATFYTHELAQENPGTWGILADQESYDFDNGPWWLIPDFDMQYTGTVSPVGQLPEGQWVSAQSDGTPTVFVLERADGVWQLWAPMGGAGALKPQQE